jgi:hypothetical protein
VKHITREKLQDLQALLASLKTINGLREKTPGVFYRKSSAFLHFHEEGEQIFADIKLDGKNFTRLPASTARQRQSLLMQIRLALQEPKPGAG